MADLADVLVVEAVVLAVLWTEDARINQCARNIPTLFSNRIIHNSSSVHTMPRMEYSLCGRETGLLATCQSTRIAQ